MLPRHGVVAVVDDDPVLRTFLSLWLRQAGYTVEEHTHGGSIRQRRSEDLLAVCLDLGLGDMPGFDVLTQLHRADPELPVIVVSAQSEVETAVAAMQSGAYDYLVKPLEQSRVIHTLRRARERRELSWQLHDLQGAQGTLIPVAESPAMRDVMRQIDQIHGSDVPVCILGESGTGKELVARTIHHQSRRRSSPFVAINCASIPESLQESELFGHERGAFTGATDLHRGRFEQAGGGTLFLDEVGEMPLSMQAKLLRVLQERVFRRVGGTRELAMNARILCATNRNLQAEVDAGRFRADLFFRLMVYPIVLPPLRARREDIPHLIGHFLRRLGADVGRSVSRVAPDALDRLVQYDWPGNVREVENVIHRAMLSCRGDQITLSELPPALRDGWHGGASAAVQVVSPPSIQSPQTLPTLRLQELEKLAIQQALQQCGGDAKAAAEQLGISRATLYRRLATMEGISLPPRKSSP
jgi:DNA-binding NtrC family response regulator